VVKNGWISKKRIKPFGIDITLYMNVLRSYRVRKSAGITLIVLFWQTRECIQKFPDLADNEIYAYNNKHSLRSNTKG
jgi:hypothetical protein